MFRAHRPIFRRVRTAVHTTIGSVSVPLCSRALCVVACLGDYAPLSIEEFNFLVYSVLYCHLGVVVALFVVPIDSNAHVFGFYLFQPTCFIETNGCVSFVQLSSDVLIFVDYVCLFGIDKF